jgi:hypothetical protein
VVIFVENPTVPVVASAVDAEDSLFISVKSIRACGKLKEAFRNLLFQTKKKEWKIYEWVSLNDFHILSTNMRHGSSSWHMSWKMAPVHSSGM